jgi:hypothetical protein
MSKDGLALGLRSQFGGACSLSHFIKSIFFIKFSGTLSEAASAEMEGEELNDFTVICQKFGVIGH